MKRSIAFIHASPAAIAPLAAFYREAAPELDIINLLDDGLLRCFQAGDDAVTQARLQELVQRGQQAYGAELALLTCSAVAPSLLTRLRQACDIPLLKIDETLAAQAVSRGKRLGVVVTFAPTLATTTQLLRDAANGQALELITEVLPEAYQALLDGDAAQHDALLCAAIERLAAQRVEAIVLAQVSMARVLPQLDAAMATPVLTSLQTSLDAIRRALQEKS